jgi:hypothetical protein
VWGVLLIIFGMVAIGWPFLAAVAVNVAIAWLIVLAGVVLSFAKILWCREINSLYSFLNPCICYNLGHVPLLATLIRSLGSPLSPPWQFAAGEPRPSATGLCPETKESTTEVDRNG